MRFIFPMLISALLTSACASIIDGTSQTLTINTTPEGADCALNREGRTIGRIEPTPGSVVVEKTKHDIFVECNKQGYHTAKFINESGTAGATWGNIAAGGLIGWGVDSASGADNKYTEIMNISLSKK